MCYIDPGRWIDIPASIFMSTFSDVQRLTQEPPRQLSISLMSSISCTAFAILDFRLLSDFIFEEGRVCSQLHLFSTGYGDGNFFIPVYVWACLFTAPLLSGLLEVLLRMGHIPHQNLKSQFYACVCVYHLRRCKTSIIGEGW